MSGRPVPIYQFLLLVLILVGARLGTGNGLTCAPPYMEEHLVGYACTVEAISTATTWLWDTSIAAMPSQRLFILIVAMAFAGFAFTKPARRSFGLRWFNQRMNFARYGPTPNGIFLPYLFATHGL